MKDLIIIGAGGFGREVAWLVERINRVEPTWRILGFIDDADELQNHIINDYSVLGKISDAKHFKNAYFVVAVGSADIRKQIVCNNSDLKYAILVDPSVEKSNFVEISEGSIICAHNLITTNIKIGKHCILNLDCTVGHDVEMGDFTTLYPSVNISGNVKCGECVEFGTGCNVIQGKKIGEHSIIGAGAVVVKDIPDYCVAVGTPALPIKAREKNEDN